MSKKANRLINSQSPYLLQHAYNPVDWYPWSPEALKKAELENKPIIVSIGYSACHWCHVMEHESFEDEITAELMNENFICIKIDREERPDLDNIYMDAVQAMGLQGGWPLNVFLMPNQKPFYGGTYFPNSKWKGLLANIADAFVNHADQLAESADNFAESIGRKETEKYGINTDSDLDLDPEELKEIITKLSDQFDPEWGGMNRIPKFPMPAIWSFALDYALLSRNEKLKNQVLFTLRKIGFGGIYDHLRGGFSRYAVDGEWFAPHFEKMLYDNGQLLELYSKAFQISQDDFFLEKVEETISWLKEEMLQEEGGFHSAQDADSEGVEGKFYTWTFEELDSILGDDMTWFSKLYNLKPKGNWEEGVNILFQTKDYQEIVTDFGMNQEKFSSKLKEVKRKLLEIRNQRIFPGKDDKILSAWNAMMSAGLIQAYFATGNREALKLAGNNLEFIKEKMTKDGQLFRSYKNKKAYTPAFLEDYAAVSRAYMLFFEASGDALWANEANQLLDSCISDFYDDSDGFFFFNNPNSEKLIANKKELFDNVIPASNSVLARSFHRMALITYEDQKSELSSKMLSGIKNLILKDPGFLCNWASLYLESLVPTTEIGIIGKGAEALAMNLQKSYYPNLVIAWSEEITASVPILAHKTPDAKGNALIYVCFNHTCHKPVSTIEEVISQLPHLA